MSDQKLTKTQLKALHPDNVQGLITAQAARDVIESTVNLNPTDASENAITSNADVVPFSIQGFTGQTANLLELKNSAGSVVASIGNTGSLSATIALTGDVTGTQAATVVSTVGGATAANVAAATALANAATNANTANAIVKRNASGDFTARNITANKIASLVSPASSGDATNKAYVDAADTNISNKLRSYVVAAATTDNRLDIPTTLEIIDGYQTVVGDRVLLKNLLEIGGHSTSAKIYIAANTTWTLSDEVFVTGTKVFVQNGTVNGGRDWICSVDAVDEDLHWNQNLQSGTGVTVSPSATGTIFSVNLTQGSGIAISGATISANLSTSDIPSLPESKITNLTTDLAALAAADVVIKRNGNVRSVYPSASNTDAARGTALRTAMAAATSGDVVEMGPGNFDLGNTVRLVITAGVHLKGQGRETTRMYSTLPQSVDSGVGILIPSNNCIVSDCWLDATLTDGTYQIPFGAQGAFGFTNVVCRNFKITGHSDCVFIWANDSNSIDFYDCYFQSQYDCVATLNGADTGTFRFFNCEFVASGPFPGSTIANNCVLKTGTYTFYDCKWSTVMTGTPTETYCLISYTGGANNIKIYNGRMSVSGATGNVYDVYNTQTYPLTISGGSGSLTNGGFKKLGNAINLTSAAVANGMTIGGVFVQGATPKSLIAESMASGDVDFGTVPAGKRWALMGYSVFNSGANTPTVYFQFKRSGTYYQITTTTSSISAGSGVSQNAWLPAIILEAGDIASIHTSASGASCWLSCVEFPATNGLKSALTFTLASGANTLYTCPTGYSAMMLTNNFLYSMGGTTGVTNQLFNGFNSSTTRTISLNIVKSGNSVASSNMILASSSFTNAARFNANVIPQTLSSGDYINITSDAAASGGLMWINLFEVPN